MAELETRIRKFIVESLMLKSNESAVDFDEPLLESGVITSFGIVELVQFLEREFSINVADRDVVPENFQTINLIAALVRSKTESSN